jgi:hypothetical protein
VIELLAELAALVPTELVAVTVNVYDVPDVKPLTVIVPEPDVDNVPVIPPGEDVAVYVVIVAPPLFDGAVYETVAVVVLVAVAVPIVGANGTFAVTAEVEFEFALTALTTLVAVTTQRIV